MGLYEFLFPQARMNRLEREIAALRGSSEESADSIRERLRRQWQEKHNPAPEMDLAGRVAALERQCATADLVIEALLEELESRGGITREELKKRMQEIDARDGTIDGRMSGAGK